MLLHLSIKITYQAALHVVTKISACTLIHEKDSQRCHMMLNSHDTNYLSQPHFTSEHVDFPP